MNHILYNISLLMVFTGIIMMTVYITKASGNNYMTNKQLLMKSNLIKNNHIENIYDYRVSQVYKKMFSEPSIWLGYQDFDPEYQTEKLYIKTKK